MLNAVGSGAQTLSHIMTVANLDKLGVNPAAAIAQIAASRWITNFGYQNTTRKTVHFESRPIQSHIEVGAFWLNNDRTDLQGIWNIDHGSIESKEFTMSAPKHTVTEKVETSGFTISMSPASVLGTAVLGCNPVTLLPTMSIQEGNGSKSMTAYRPAVLSADRLFIRIDNGILRGSSIKANVLEQIVNGNFTVRTLNDTLQTKNHSSEIAASIGSLFSEAIDVKLPFATADHKLGKFPSARFTNEKSISEKVDDLAQVVGYEKFYLKVGKLLHDQGAEIGLVHDGIVNRNGIDAQKVIREEVELNNHTERTVIAPCVSDYVACMGQIDEFNKIRNQFKQQRCIEGASIKQAEKESEQITQETVEKVDSFKQKMIASQKKVAIKAKETAEKLDQAQGEIMNCSYTQELDDTVVKANLEQLAILNEYNQFAKTLKPGAKSYFDRIMDSTIEFGKTLGDGCYHFNDKWERAADIADVNYFYEGSDDFDVNMRQTVKEHAINRDMRARMHGLAEFGFAALHALEVAGIASSAKVMSTASKEMKLVRLFSEARITGESKISIGKPMYDKPLDWNAVPYNKGKQSVIDHIANKHTVTNLRKPNQGVFFGDFQTSINKAWTEAKVREIKPITVKDVDYYVVPMENSGFTGGSNKAVVDTLNHVTIMTQKGTSNLINGFPTNKAGPELLEQYIQSTIFGGIK